MKPRRSKQPFYWWITFTDARTRYYRNEEEPITRAEYRKAMGAKSLPPPLKRKKTRPGHEPKRV